MSLATDQADEDALALLKLGPNSRIKGIGLLYRAYATGIRRFFLGHGQTETAARTLIEDVFCQIMQKCDAFRGECPISAWIWTIAHHQLLIKLAAQDSAPGDHVGSPAVGEQSLDPDPGEGETPSALQSGLREFSSQHPEHAQVLTLACLHGWTEREIAGFLGRDLGETHTYVRECREYLRRYLP